MAYNAEQAGTQPANSAYIQNKTKLNKWWKSNIYVDLQTGERITKKNAETNYIIIKKKKNVTYIKQLNKNRQYETIGHIEYTNECTRNGKQIKLGKW